MAKRFFKGEYVGLDGVAYDGYYTVLCDDETGEPYDVRLFTITVGPDAGESFDPIGATLEEVLELPESADEPTVISRIELDFDHEGNLYIVRAWAGNYLAIGEYSDARPQLVIENGLVTDILYNGLDIELPEFEPFPAEEGIHDLGN